MVWFLFICNLLIPAVLIPAGVWLERTPPDKPNGLVGYRTNRSRKSRESWEFAQRYCGRLFRRDGAVLLVVSALVQLPFLKDASEEALGVLTLVLEGVQILVILLGIALVERELKRRFDDRGRPKTGPEL